MTAADLARALRAIPCGQQQWLACCPAHEDETPSLSIREGDKVDILLHCHAGCSQDAVISALRDRGLWSCAERGYAKEKRTSIPSRRSNSPEQDRSRNALKIFREAKPIADTPADAYLLSRGFDIMFDLPSSALLDLRFHSACPRGKGAGGAMGMTQPAMIALLRDVTTGVPVAIHRTFLRGTEKDSRAMLGPCIASAVMLTPFIDLRRSGAGGGAGHLQLTEGIETALAVLRRFGGHVWATGTASKISSFPVLPSIRALTVRADNDANATGRRAAQAVVARYREHGVAADWTMPEATNSDYAG